MVIILKFYKALVVFFSFFSLFLFLFLEEIWNFGIFIDCQKFDILTKRLTKTKREILIKNSISIFKYSFEIFFVFVGKEQYLSFFSQFAIRNNFNIPRIKIISINESNCISSSCPRYFSISINNFEHFKNYHRTSFPNISTKNTNFIFNSI